MLSVVCFLINFISESSARILTSDCLFCYQIFVGMAAEPSHDPDQKSAVIAPAATPIVGTTSKQLEAFRLELAQLFEKTFGSKETATHESIIVYMSEMHRLYTKMERISECAKFVDVTMASDVGRNMDINFGDKTPIITASRKVSASEWCIVCGAARDCDDCEARRTGTLKPCDKCGLERDCDDCIKERVHKYGRYSPFCNCVSCRIATRTGEFDSQCSK